MTKEKGNNKQTVLQLEMPKFSTRAEQCRSACYDKQRDEMSTATITITGHNHQQLNKYMVPIMAMKVCSIMYKLKKKDP